MSLFKKSKKPNKLNDDEAELLSMTNTDSPVESESEGGGKKALNHSLDANKIQQFQVYLNIIQVKEVNLPNLNCYVTVQLEDEKKTTDTKKGADSAYFNQNFAFDFKKRPKEVFGNILKFSLYNKKSRLGSATLIGSFKIDIGTIWHQPEQLFAKKWGILRDPKDMQDTTKGYLQCDIGILAKGESLNIANGSSNENDDIESNLLISDGVSKERFLAKLNFKIYLANDLPQMDSSLTSNMKGILGGPKKDLVDPFVKISFAGMVGKTSVIPNSYNPVWNEQITFVENFPPLCQQLKIELLDSDKTSSETIATQYIDLKQISSNSEHGFLPTFGPSYVYFYGSNRDFNLVNVDTELNQGVLDGISYRGKLLMEISTEIINTAESNETRSVKTEKISENLTDIKLKTADFILFASIFEASMINKKYAGKKIYFEISMGNYGNTLDSYDKSITDHSSTTSPMKSENNDGNYFLPLNENKPCMFLTGKFPDTQFKMFCKNMLRKLIESMEKVLDLYKDDPDKPIEDLFSFKESLLSQCDALLNHLNAFKPKENRLDVLRMPMLQHEIAALAKKLKNWNYYETENVKKYVQELQIHRDTLVDFKNDPQQSMPDAIIWMIENDRRVAYVRIKASDLIYSPNESQCGKLNGKIETTFLLLPGNQDSKSMDSNNIGVKMRIYFWLSDINHSNLMYENIPKGYELQNGKSEYAKCICYKEKKDYQLRVNLFEARSLLRMDKSGLSDPFAVVNISSFRKSTQKISKTINPKWDETLVFEKVSIYGNSTNVQKNPPTVTVEIYDHDKFGDSEYMGEITLIPNIISKGSVFNPSKLQWFDLQHSGEPAGELLASFDLIEICAERPLTIAKPDADRSVIPVPPEIRPALSKHRVELYFWGLRKMQKVNMLSVKKPRIDVMCSGKSISSSTISNASKNCNFSQNFKSFEVDLPTDEIYSPSMTFKCVDCRSFGNFTLVGTYQIKSIHKFKFPNTFEKKIPKNKALKNKSNSSNSLLTMRTSRDDVVIEIGTEHSSVNYESNDTQSMVSISPSKSSMSGKGNEEKDWWTKYFQAKSNKYGSSENISSIDYYKTELEKQYNDFMDTLITFPMIKGKENDDQSDDNIIAYFKGKVRIVSSDYNLTSLPMEMPLNTPLKYLLRVYIIKAFQLQPMDANGKADPYIVLKCGKQTISDKENYISCNLEPVFGKCFELNCTFPQDYLLKLKLMDWDAIGSDELMGETVIDLENRFYSKTRGQCGLSKKYEKSGYNKWRDIKPTQILSDICIRNKLGEPSYENDKIVIQKHEMIFNVDEIQEWKRSGDFNEHMALAALHRWEEVPVIGSKLVSEHIECRSLYIPSKPGIEQGKIEMWIDMFPLSMNIPPPINISPRKPKSYELRIIIWNTSNVILVDEALFGGNKTSDIYVKGWLKEDDKQQTDVHYKSSDGKGSFNWRFIFPFDYFASENCIVVKRKDSVFSNNLSEEKIPAQMNFQIWDADCFSSDDILGCLSFELNDIPKGAKTAKACTLKMFNSPKNPSINLFKQKRIRGWWPLTAKNQAEKVELTGKVEAEFILLTKEDAEKNPAGRARSEPDPLPVPKRPEDSFSTFMNPLKSLKFVFWRNNKWRMMKYVLILFLIIFVLLFIYSIPGYTAEMLMKKIFQN